MTRKIDLQKVYLEKVKSVLTPVEQKAMEKALRVTAKQLLLTLSLLVLISATDASAICKNTPINPITDICWQCMFPVRLGGMSFGRGNDLPPGETDAPLCECMSQGQMGTHSIGISTAFWEHARIIETVKDPWCFPTLGSSLNSGGNFNALLSGSNRTDVSGNTESNYSSQQAHWFVFPVWQLINLFVDFPCIEKNPFDLAYMTEVDPMWNDDTLSFILNPEALLFGNPITQLACMADTVAAAVGAPVDPLFWCQGAWGSAYPLDGSSSVTNPMHLNASIADRMIFKLGREMLLYDTAINNCAQGGVLSPIRVKSHYELQLAKPRRGSDCVPVGRPDFLWGTGLNPPLGAGGNSPDNFMWILTRARRCCVNYYSYFAN